LDKSGEIEYDEFKKLLCSLLKVPVHLELPQSRVRQFWTETDLDGGGSIEFEEFLIFYTKFFDASQTGDPLEDFYRGLRPNAMRDCKRASVPKIRHLDAVTGLHFPHSVHSESSNATSN